MTQDPDPRTAPEDGEDATDTGAPVPNEGRSAEEPAEGADDVDPRTDGSPQG